MKRATWKNGKRTVTGNWDYYQPSDVFVIRLDSRDRITGQYRIFRVHGDTPEWGNWRLVRE